MEPLPQKFQRYLDEVMGLKVVIRPFVEDASLPHFLYNNYVLKELEINSRCYLGLFLRGEEDISPVTLEKHLRQLPLSQFAGYCLVADRLTTYVRKQLINKRIPFVVPGNQLYWPVLGMAIASRAANRRPANVELVSPATQVVIIYGLLAEVGEGVTPKNLGEQLGYTAMTMSRALDEIEALQLGTVTKAGRERLLSFPQGKKSLWQQAKDRMRNPVRETARLWAKQLPERFQLLAGESALAACTMLGQPKTPVYAVGREGWKAIQKKKPEQLPVEEPGSCVVQIWRYDPTLFARQNRVDPFSLALSLQGIYDERVQIAMDEMMEELTW